MAGTVNRRPEVTRDLIELADYLARRSLEASDRFLAAVESAFAFLAENPHLGVRCSFHTPQTEDLRWWRVKGFENYLIFYRPIDQGIDVVRVLHSARNWESILQR